MDKRDSYYVIFACRAQANGNASSVNRYVCDVIHARDDCDREDVYFLTILIDMPTIACRAIVLLEDFQKNLLNWLKHAEFA